MKTAGGFFDLYLILDINGYKIDGLMAALAVQLDLFEEQTEDLFLQKEVDQLILSYHNLRRGLFARNNELEKRISRQQEEIEVLKRQFNLMMRNK